jgi:Na+-transporting NADH:ubiquinone oxidoreductase subunit C
VVKFDEAQGVYVCTLENGDVKYVLPLKGQGMWGGISCFLAIDDDKNTVYGAYFNHESETAGLGAEIKDNADWQAKFQGKKIFADETKETLALSVEKAVNNETTVDAVTGATVTSTAVSKMLQDQLTKYMDFLKK